MQEGDTTDAPWYSFRMSRNHDSADAGVVAAIGQRVARLRAVRGWTQLELASRAGIARQTLNLVERGKLEPRAGTLARIAVALRITTGELYPDHDATRDEAHALVDRLTPDAIAPAVGALRILARSAADAPSSAAPLRPLKVKAVTRRKQGSRTSEIASGKREASAK